MIAPKSIVAIYDFELFPFALGDVLTWNVRTAMRCVELDRECVDIYICADERYPAGVHQLGIINAQNFDLFFSELYGAFGTHPRLGNIHIFRNRDELIDVVRRRADEDPVNSEAVQDYLSVLNYRELNSLPNIARRKIFFSIRDSVFAQKILKRGIARPVKQLMRSAFLPNEAVINDYFTKYIYSHKAINAFAERHGSIPLLKPSLGCTPDVEELIARRFRGKKLVPFHLRLRRLDGGYGGEHSYARDSDFLEWFDFLREAGELYPEVQFIALGRLQEKPLELLRLPNVTSLRIFGLGLGHELTLMLKSDLFIGTSSGFAALANFSELPYFVTRMNPGSCDAYAIPEGADSLPFALPGQKLIYEQETAEMLMRLLREGLSLPLSKETSIAASNTRDMDAPLDVHGWLNARLRLMNSAATTCRFFNDDKYRREETAYLLLLSLEQAKQALLNNNCLQARTILNRIQKNFADLCADIPQFNFLMEICLSGAADADAVRARLEQMDIQVSGFVGAECVGSHDAAQGWRPTNWVLNGDFKPLPDEIQPALEFRANSPNSYWQIERFVATRNDGRIIVKFDAKNSESPSLHRIYLFEDESYFSVGQFVAESEWRSFEVPITAKTNCELRLQIDQPDSHQWLAIRNLRIVDADAIPVVQEKPVMIPMENWVGGDGATSVVEDGHDCRQWPVAGRKGYAQTPILPTPGESGLLVRFEARADQPAPSFTPVYLFEGEQYRKVADYAFGSEWRTFTLLLNADRAKPIKVQVDYPDAVNILSIRNFQAIPVAPVKAEQC